MRRTRGFRDKLAAMRNVIQRLQSVADSFPKTPDGIAIAVMFREQAEKLERQLAGLPSVDIGAEVSKTELSAAIQLEC
jgi:hypothetical protein